MAVKIFSCLAEGIEGRLVEVEADILQGLSAFNIVGLGDAAVQEAKERIRSAIKNSGAQYPQQKKVINLAPADLKKHGPHFDLPMAVALLAASGQLKIEELNKTLIVGELALDGKIRPVNGVLTMALFAQKAGWKKILVPKPNASEALAAKEIEVIAIENLKELMESCNNGYIQNLTTEKLDQAENTGQDHVDEEISENNLPDIDDIKGHTMAKRALMIAAAGGHHLLFTGSPGVGKTLLAKSLPSILPPLSEAEVLEVMQIYSAAGFFKNGLQWIKQRPFREVHSSCSLPALIGGGTTLNPGEISLAHHGVLFLDEIAEFPRSHLEVLRQPLEAKEIHLSRASGALKYPAEFTLVAGMNPCPCGYFGDPVKECQCRPYQIIQYQKKLSGPLMDRLDLIIEVERQSLKKFSIVNEADEIIKQNKVECTYTNEKQTKTNPAGTNKVINKAKLPYERYQVSLGQRHQSEPRLGGASESQVYISKQNIQKKILEARKIQEFRFYNSKTFLNANLRPSQFQIFCRLDKSSQDFIEEAGEKLNFSGRNYHQMLKIARTIADLDQREVIQLQDLAEALQYRARTFQKSTMI